MSAGECAVCGGTGWRACPPPEPRSRCGECHGTGTAALSIEAEVAALKEHVARLDEAIRTLASQVRMLGRSERR